MGRVQDAPPEYPDALAVYIEKSHGPKPPSLILTRQKHQSRPS
jgi:hypothetical protein